MSGITMAMVQTIKTKYMHKHLILYEYMYNFIAICLIYPNMGYTSMKLTKYVL